MHSSRGNESTLLPGWWLRAARVLWLTLTAVSIVTFVLAVPVRQAELMRLAPEATRPIQQLSPVESQLLSDAGVPVATYALIMLALEIAVQVVFTALGLLIFVRDSRNWVALLISLGLIVYATYATPVLDAIPRSDLPLGLVGSFVQSLGLLIALAFFFIFPDGRFVPRWTFPFTIGWNVLLWSAFLFPQAPWNFLNPWTLSPLAFVALMVCWGTGLIAQFARFFSERSAARRQQTKWIVYSATLAVVGYAIALLPRVFVLGLRESGMPGLIYNLVAVPMFSVAVVTFPFAMTFSILRYRLWDIDRLISRTLIYGMSSVALVLIYLGAILLLQQLIQRVVQRGSVLAIVLSSIGVALLAAPVRDRIQALVDRRFFRAKYNAERTVEEFSKTARDTVDLNELTDKLTGVVNATLQPSHAFVWIKGKGTTATRPATRPVEPVGLPAGQP